MKGSACRSLFRSGPETPTRKWWLDGSLTFRPPPLVRVGLPGGSAILKVPRSFWNALSPCGMFANLTYYWKPFRVMPGAETSVIGDQRDSSAPGMGTSLASACFSILRSLSCANRKSPPHRLRRSSWKHAHSTTSMWASAFFIASTSCALRLAVPSLITILFSLPVKERHLVIFAYRRSGIFPDVEGLIGRDAERNGSRDSALSFANNPSASNLRRFNEITNSCVSSQSRLQRAVTTKKIKLRACSWSKCMF
jgi:hypothetical protein